MEICNLPIHRSTVPECIRVHVKVLKHHCGFGEVYLGHQVLINGLAVYTFTGNQANLSVQENYSMNEKASKELCEKIASALMKH